MQTPEDFFAATRHELELVRKADLFKAEQVISSAQDVVITTLSGQNVLNFCANNYLGLASHPEVIEAARAVLSERGFGMSSVRFICGTQDLHKELEARLSRFLCFEDTILYSSAFDANCGLFETLLGPEDAVISDSLNHASIIDGIRLCKAQRYRYKHDDLDDLRDRLREADAGGARNKLVFTDGVFSMDGTIARLDRIRALCDEFGALLGVDDSHATGFVGKTGRGTHEHHQLLGRVDILTGTLGKALGGASGGFTCSRSEVVELLRQRSRPYLFSNTLAPVIAGASLRVLDLLEADTRLRDKLETNTQQFRSELSSRGFSIKPGSHPIIPVMLHEAEKAQRFARRLLELGVLVTGFFYPVVPRGEARVRVQISAQHTPAQLDTALRAFAQAGQELGLVA